MNLRESMDIVDEAMLGELTGYRDRDETKSVVDAFKDFKGSVDVDGRRTTLRQFLNTVREKGFTPISHGAHGAVITAPGLDYVIRIFRNDPGYNVFLKIALANQNNSAFPKFRGKVMKFMGDYYAVRMEKLNELESSMQLSGLMYLMNMVLHGTVTNQDALVNFTYDHMVEVKPEMRAGLAYGLEYFESHPALIDALTKLSKKLYEHDLMSDIRDGNVMARANGEIVLTDPLYDQNAIH